MKPEARVGICVERGLEMIVGAAGGAEGGGAYVPLDPAYPAARLELHAARQCAAGGTDAGHLAGRLREIKPEVAVMDMTEAAAWKDRPTTNPDRATTGLRLEHLAYIIYTSGSTGKPKGVMTKSGIGGLRNLIAAQLKSLR